MTISTTASRASYNGNGVTTAFSFPNLFFSNTDLRVILVNTTGVSVDQVLDTDYTVTGAGADAGGTVTMVAAPGVGERLVIVRQVPLVQETDYTAGDSFPAESHERALDYLTMQTQQLMEQLTRTLQLPIASDADASSINVEAVEIVAGIAADVTAVADVAADIELAADNIVAIQGAAGNAAAAAASAVAADASADAAAASAALIALPLAIAQGGTGQTSAAAAFNALKQNASESATGVVELATAAEVAAGADNTRAVTPQSLRQGPIQSMVRLHSSPGNGSTNTVIRRFTTVVTNVGSDITYADSATLGGTFTINNAGVYAISYTESIANGNVFGLSLNSSQLTTSIISITAADILAVNQTPGATVSSQVAWTGYLPAGSVIRAHGSTAGVGAQPILFTIARVA